MFIECILIAIACMPFTIILCPTLKLDVHITKLFYLLVSGKQMPALWRFRAAAQSMNRCTIYRHIKVVRDVLDKLDTDLPAARTRLAKS